MKTCECCGESFTQAKNHSDQKYCTNRCRKRHWLMLRRPIVACLCCGESFRVYKWRRNYCSAKCRDRQRKRNEIAARRQGQKQCEWCDNMFLPQRKQPYQRFCTELCREQDRQQRQAGIQPGMVVEWEYRGTWRSRRAPRIKLSGVVVSKPGLVAHVFCAGMTHEVRAFKLRVI